MILRQILHTSPSVASSYLFGCGSKHVGCVVDPVTEPAWEVEPELEWLTARVWELQSESASTSTSEWRLE